ncbi:cell division protein ZapA [Sphingomonas sp. MAH-20]|jgi:cell division protein ZapA|uniref:Cell division protein ZapA n=1 Tax=Sphingomonas horti TaxID=2682842 RepID=A0A6I4J2B1_9SPHN|nr:MULTISPECIES: cell division protein ZapA [Sphingomonas]MBA2919695.1 cell division protein ZapA [Sphingomonas sp. CGMCC 1.13658]MVO78575.1 cell division protein ZapA [Sphingomonas horti]
MAEVTIEVGGRRYDVACRDGEEAQLRRVAMLVDQKAEQARAAVGNANESRLLLLAALLLADELNDLRQGTRAPLPPDTGSALADAVEELAARVETLAEHLESGAAAA